MQELSHRLIDKIDEYLFMSHSFIVLKFRFVKSRARFFILESSLMTGKFNFLNLGTNERLD